VTIAAVEMGVERPLMAREADIQHLSVSET
jgi:hypothetical protein